MCGSKYDWGVFDEDDETWEFPRYTRGGKPVQSSELVQHSWDAPLVVVMRSARRWARALRISRSITEWMPVIHEAFAMGFAEELRMDGSRIVPTVYPGEYEIIEVEKQ